MVSVMNNIAEGFERKAIKSLNYFILCKRKFR
ncbi:MAG: hypothetical protein IPI04_12110 [Ignavibacteria bacterium]|nr:hypothetical protein [Ignavibacteria bacterium]